MEKCRKHGKYENFTDSNNCPVCEYEKNSLKDFLRYMLFITGLIVLVLGVHNDFKLMFFIGIIMIGFWYKV